MWGRHPAMAGTGCARWVQAGVLEDGMIAVGGLAAAREV
jgi:hypothetical protein